MGRRFNIDGTSEPCTRAGLLDKVAGSLLCAAHAEHGLVPASEARALIRTALGRSTQLSPDLSLWNCLGAKDGGVGQLTGDELTAVLRVCDIELQRRCTESPGNLTRCRTALSKMLPPSALEMLTALAHVATERDEARKELDKLVPDYEWDDLGDADRNIYSTSDFNPIAMDLGSLKLAAEMQLNRQQLSPATTLKDVLTKLKLTAKADTRSNDYTQAELCKKHKLPVVLHHLLLPKGWAQSELPQLAGRFAASSGRAHLGRLPCGCAPPSLRGERP